MTDSTSWRPALELFPAQGVETLGGTVTYREGGEGETIVFLHGISSGSGSWIHQLSHFAVSARCVAWDAPGYGGSFEMEAASPTAAEYANSFQQFLDALKIRQALLVAHSLGALMATAFTSRHGERVRGMVLLDPATGYGAAPRKVAEQKLAARLEQLSEVGVEGLANRRAQALVSPDASAEAVQLIQWNMRLLRPSGYAQAARMLSLSNLLDDASGCSHSVLVASGTADTITPPDACRRASEAFPNGRYCVLPGLGHASYIEDHAMVNQHLDDFRKRIAHD